MIAKSFFLLCIKFLREISSYLGSYSSSSEILKIYWNFDSKFVSSALVQFIFKWFIGFPPLAVDKKKHSFSKTKGMLLNRSIKPSVLTLLINYLMNFVFSSFLYLKLIPLKIISNILLLRARNWMSISYELRVFDFFTKQFDKFVFLLAKRRLLIEYLS